MTKKSAPSKGESEAWKQLRGLREEGFAFRREHRLGRYRADFVCLRRRLIVEVDGPLHDTADARLHDERRDAWLKVEGFVVLRFKDKEILSSANWLGQVRDALIDRPEVGYRRRGGAETPPPGGGRGRGECQ